MNIPMIAFLATPFIFIVAMLKLTSGLSSYDPDDIDNDDVDNDDVDNDD